MNTDVSPRCIEARAQNKAIRREANAGPNNDETNISSTHAGSITLLDTFFVNLSSNVEKTCKI